MLYSKGDLPITATYNVDKCNNHKAEWKSSVTKWFYLYKTPKTGQMNLWYEKKNDWQGSKGGV